MDEQLKMQYIELEYGVTVCAVPSATAPRLVSEIYAGYGQSCIWTKEERILAYKHIIRAAEKIIAEMEAGDEAKN